MSERETLFASLPQLEARIAEQAMMVRSISRSFREGSGAQWPDADIARRTFEALLDQYEEVMRHEPY